jgi:bacterial/archaeal transporter family-2 protein
MKITWLIIVFICGALLPLQAGLNARLGKSIESPVYASMFSFIIGAIAVGIYLQFTKETISWAGVRSASVYSWIGGGITGAIFITATMIALPRIGMALTFGLVVAGQVIIAVLLDHFNILVAQQHSINIWRVLGIALIIGGVIVVRKF